jgi:hypothetical protein
MRRHLIGLPAGGTGNPNPLIHHRPHIPPTTHKPPRSPCNCLALPNSTNILREVWRVQNPPALPAAQNPYGIPLRPASLPL